MLMLVQDGQVWCEMQIRSEALRALEALTLALEAFEARCSHATTTTMLSAYPSRIYTFAAAHAIRFCVAPGALIQLQCVSTNGGNNRRSWSGGGAGAGAGRKTTAAGGGRARARARGANGPAARGPADKAPGPRRSALRASEAPGASARGLGRRRHAIST